MAWAGQLLTSTVGLGPMDRSQPPTGQRTGDMAVVVSAMHEHGPTFVESTVQHALAGMPSPPPFGCFGMVLECMAIRVPFPAPSLPHSINT
jgi:hypothetical protein